MDKVFSNRLYLLKAIAIFGVITLHSNYSVGSFPFVTRFIGNFAAVGVIIFFILSGYFFNAKEASGEFWRKKSLYFIIPWMIGGSLVYSVRILGGDSLEVKGYVNFLFGNGSYLYFATILFLTYLLFRVFRGTMLVVYTSMGFTLSSCILTSCNVIPQTVDANKWIFTYYTNPYLNIFNWIGFFGFGILLKKFDLLKKYSNIQPKYKWLISTACCIGWLILCLFVETAYYWTPWSLLNEGLLLIVLYSAVHLFSRFERVWMEGALLIGKNTLFIYLYHLPFIGKLLPMNQAVINLIRPWIVLIIFYVFICIVKKLSQKPKMKSMVGILIGIK